MKKLTRSLIGPSALAAVFFVGPTIQAQQDQNGFVRVVPDQIKWVDDVDGVQRATIYGDPTKPGPYVVRIKFPRGVMSTNHSHGEDRYAVVLKGTWYTGTGTAFEPGKTVPIPTGGFMKHPANQPHFDGAKEEEVILQLSGVGPSTTVRVREGERPFAPSLQR